jgi:hypothetical protein
MERKETIDPLKEYREKFAAARKILYPDSPGTAMEVYRKLQGAVPFFQLGVELGRLSPELAEKLIKEIGDQLKEDEQHHQEDLYPAKQYRNTSYRLRQ